MQRDEYLVRLICVILGLSAIFGRLSVHLYHLQIKRHDELYAKAKVKYTGSRTEEGRRGEIFDVNGNLLAGNLACRDVLAEPRRFRDDVDDVLNTLCSELDVRRKVLRARFDRALDPEKDVIEVVVKRGVDIDRTEAIATYDFPGVRFVDTYRRYYPKRSLLANVLGFTSVVSTLNPQEDGEGDGPKRAPCLRGMTGIEKLMDKQLQPTSGRSVYERDRRGNPLKVTRAAVRQASDGARVYVTVDEPIQQIVEEELRHMVARHRPRAAYGVMADPKTGAILAMAQYPTFNPNRRTRMRPEQWKNRMLVEGFEPGSVMKCVAVAGALDYRTVSLDDTFFCEEGYWIYCGRPLRDGGHSFGELTVREIVQKSSNIGTAKVALKMGERKLFQTLKRFGFGEPTGLGFAGEAHGIFRALPDWDGLSITRFPIGQGILVTPLQLVQAYGALANEGVMMQLRIIDRVECADGQTLNVTRPQVKQRAVRPYAARQMVSAMSLVTREGGTAERAAVDGYSVAGKTGTAQKVINGRYSREKYVSSFIGFVPAVNPAFVLLVVADEPSRNGYYGGTVCAPTFSRIAEKTLRYLQVAPAAVRPPQHLSEPETIADASSRSVSRLP